MQHRPLPPAVWQAAFSGDPDEEFLNYLVNVGVHVLPLNALPPAFKCSNHASLFQSLDKARPIIQEEVSLGFIVPAPPQCDSYWVHPLGAVPKGDSVRIIHDFSSPHGASINQMQHHWHRSWMSADSIMAMIQPGDFMAKTDISHYYRNLPVHPAQWPLLAFEFDGVTYWDTRLPFGLRIAPEVADRVTAALCRRAAAVGGITRLAAVVDDFTIMHQDQHTCDSQWNWLMSDFTALGLPPHPVKSEASAQLMKVLGILWDSVGMTASLDPDKLAKLKAKLILLLGAKKITKQELQSILGHLYYASRLVFAGRTFVFHLASLLRQHHARPSHHRIYMPASARADLQWWLDHIDECNGKQAILPSKPVHWRQFQTDASLTGAEGLPCIGIWMAGAYVSLSATDLQGMFDDVPDLTADINIWELYAVVVACRLFSDFMAGGHWRVRSDNSSTVAWLMHGRCRSPAVAAWLREVMSLALSHSFRLTAKHIPGAANVIADTLSRRNWGEFQAYLSQYVRSGVVAGVDSAPVSRC
jgi:hypothetical protein